MLMLFTSSLRRENFFEIAWVCLCSVFSYRPCRSTAPFVSLFSAKVGGNAQLLLSCTDKYFGQWGFFSMARWGLVKWITQMFDRNKQGQMPNRSPQDETVLRAAGETGDVNLETHTQTNPCQMSSSQSCFCLCIDPSPTKSNLQRSFWLTGCPLFHFKLKNFINPDQLWQDGRVGYGRNAAEVITWFRLSWFWFNRGRVCQKISRRSPVSVPCQIPPPLPISFSLSLPPFALKKSKGATETQNERRDVLNKEG